tara:strand:- start:1865 stop:2200 length:336 start_codon:yes stop_codon:yes gene_type:complete
MDEYEWMPSLELQLNTKKRDIDLTSDIMSDYFINKTLNLSMLENYVSIVMDIHNRINGDDYHVKYKMKYCTEEMFTSFGIEAPKGIAKNRLCPEFPEGLEDYKVAGSVTNK